MTTYAAYMTLVAISVSHFLWRKKYHDDPVYRTFLGWLCPALLIGFFCIVKLVMGIE